ncbi:CDP-glycerol glycerophosphotransferase family protein [Jeotgalicoccus halotolerans]|uniref:CDP-glycerol glycerophosphotransferase (TagB/SpsB family) n=2 Tax=Jeotgalicoccus halotolerans TaxID=157227 RepID=A0A3E0AR15_9STAP|nr:CDP-glycerol glycerophosphotransferase family protein [Jeotgalicoccus halotolerans]REG20602.1 CDP-glycerol glycerophosphotransferase (TagB/SpsB family) [Jeotgalicoccus halotolerans]
MNEIRNKLIKMIPRSMRILTRKVYLRDVTEYETYFSINLILKRFYHINLKEKINVILISSEHTEVLDFALEKNILSIKLTPDILSQLESNSSINITVEEKHMIIEQQENIQEKTSFVKDGNYYNISANGVLQLERLFSEYTFNESYMYADEIQTSYECLEISFYDNFNLNGYGLALLYPNKIIALDSTRAGTILKTNDFKNVTMGRAAVYVVKGFEMTPVKLSINEMNLITQEHNLKFLSESHELYAYIENHEIEMTAVKAEVIEDNVTMRMAYSENFEIKHFVVSDTVSEEETLFKVNSSRPGEFETEIPLSTLVDSFSRKKFKLITVGDEPLTLQPNVGYLEELGFGERLVINYQHENIKMWFYRRKDTALGFKVTRPRIRRQVTRIEGFNLEGFIKGRENFSGCSTYMIFEDRYSKEAVQLLIDEDFVIDLTKLDLKSIKSKDKTIIDVFIAMISEEGETVRKEKIKYKFSDYKKDNYYGSHSEKSGERNVHYHLITTTPFDNLKIETFTIPTEITIPDNAVEKDYNTWLVGERYDTAQDNGYAFYKYLKENTDVNAYYAIESSALDYEKIKSDPHVLPFGSDKHFEVALKAGVLLGTHDLENLLPYKPARGFFNYEDTVRVFLQHGVLGRKRVEYHKKYYDLPFDLFIVSSDPEKYDVVMRKLCYDEEDVAVTGLARFDSLPRGNKTKDILLMPTWRDWINTDEAFLTSQYFHNYNGLIHNERLIKILEDNDVQLNFYPHYRAQMYFNDEILNPSSNIKFIQLGTRTVQELLIDHSLLITDYSSVSFDFTLMNKPVIYYHFDVRKFFRQGKLRPLFQTFIGDIARTEDDLIDLIESQIKLNFKSEQPDISGIFKYQDHHNSERIYNSVKEKIKGRIDY